MSKDRTCYLCESGTMGRTHCVYTLNEEQCPILIAHEEDVNEKRWKKDE